MADFNVRADAVDVEQIMAQIRARIRDKRGVDYTEAQIQELAKIRLEKFLDPKGVRSDLLEHFQRSAQLDAPPTYVFDAQTLTRAGNPLVAFVRRLLYPLVRVFFNPLIHAVSVQTQINRYLLDRAERDVLVYEVMHNLVVEMTRTGIEVKNMQMRVESIAGRLDFNERRARALEAVVQYKPEARADRGDRPERDRQDRDRGERDRSSRERNERPDRGDRPERAERHDRGDRNERGDRGDRTPRPDTGDRVSPQPPAAAAPAAATNGAAPDADPITGGESLRSRRRRRRRGRRSGPGFVDPSGQTPTGQSVATGGPGPDGGTDSGADDGAEDGGDNREDGIDSPSAEPPASAIEASHHVAPEAPPAAANDSHEPGPGAEHPPEADPHRP